jgi:tRNA nucleotidyltransferase/poly(A) polymerase
MFDQKKFESSLPPVFQKILEKLFHHGYNPRLVGGAVRVFFLMGQLGHDWDIELAHETIAFDKTQWKILGKDLSEFGKLTYLPYDIIRIEHDGFQFEFSPPRIEHYKDNVHDHSNFDAEFSFKLAFSEAVKRRDFSINAIGINLKSKKEFEVLDPLEGLRHLHEKVLHPAGPDFAKDPVRFLRAYRFREKLKFSFSNELNTLLDSMNVGSVTPAYLWSEMQKSGNPLSFLETLIKTKDIHPELKLPVEGEFRDIAKVLHDPKRHESWIIALEWMNVSSEAWRNYFSVSSDTGRRLARWASTSKEFQAIAPEIFQGEFEIVRDKPEFEKLFDWYFTTKQLLQKNPELPLMAMIETYLPEWIYLYRFEAPKDVKHIDPPFRAKYQVWNLCQRI